MVVVADADIGVGVTRSVGVAACGALERARTGSAARVSRVCNIR